MLRTIKTQLVLISFVLLFARLTGAVAPDSIAGKVYRSNSYLQQSRYETTIVFGTDGRFIFLKDAWGLGLTGFAKVAVQVPRLDGTYRYQRISEVDGNANIDLSFDDGTVQSIRLLFTSSNGGGSNSPPVSSFFLTDLATSQSVPAKNVSMLGRLTAGQPLIVGFIVPGTPPPPRVGSIPPAGERTQEVVIRVVGPSLQQFGISNGWTDPDFQLYKGSSLAAIDEGHNPDWEGGRGEGLSPDSGKGLTKIFSYLGAFPLLPGAKDAVDVVRLTPGAYTVVCNTQQNDIGGEVLIEVYFLP